MIRIDHLEIQICSDDVRVGGDTVRHDWWIRLWIAGVYVDRSVHDTCRRMRREVDGAHRIVPGDDVAVRVGQGIGRRRDRLHFSRLLNREQRRQRNERYPSPDPYRSELGR